MEWMLLPLKRYAQFSGRSRRKEFWMWVLFVIIVSIALSLVDAALGLGGSTQYGRGTVPAGATGFAYGAGVRGGILTTLFNLAVLIPYVAVAVRRLHDVDRSGWWLLAPALVYGVGFALMMAAALVIGGLLLFAGFIMVIVLLVWQCQRGTIGPNRFGPDPLDPDHDELARRFA